MKHPRNKMKCPSCGRDLSKDFKTVLEIGRLIGIKQGYKDKAKEAYKLGLQDGQSKLQQTINLLEKTNFNLFLELKRLDLVYPEAVNSVVLSRKEVESFTGAFRRLGSKYMVTKLNKIIKAQLGSTLSAEARLRELIDEMTE